MKKQKNSRTKRVPAADQVGHDAANAAWTGMCDVLRPRIDAERSRIEDLMAKANLDLLRTPATYVFFLALKKRCDVLLEEISRPQIAFGQQFQNLMNEMIELEIVLFGNTRACSESLGVEFLDAITRKGLRYSDARHFVDHGSLFRPGAPRDSMTSVLALEAKLLGYSYRDVAEMLCKCAKEQHDAHCIDAIRKRIKPLEPLFTKYLDSL